MRPFVTGAAMAFRSKFKEYPMPYPTDQSWIHDGWNALILSAIGAFGVPIQEKLILYRQHRNQQIGASVPDLKINLWAQYKNLKEDLEASFPDWEKKRNKDFILLENRFSSIKEKFEFDSDTFQKNKFLLEQLKIHIENRKISFNHGGLKKFWLILIELYSGRYKKFSFSWKSAVSDLILR